MHLVTPTLASKLTMDSSQHQKTLDSAKKSVSDYASHVVSQNKKVSQAGLVIFNLFKSIWQSLASSVTPFSAFYDKMLQFQTALNQLHGAWVALEANIFAAFLPIIMQVVNWLTTMINKLSQIAAALAGQTTYYQAITLAATQAGNAQKGALAAFDELNVLQRDNNQVILTQQAIPDSVLKQVADFKKTLGDLWNEAQKIWTDPKAFWADRWTTIKQLAFIAWYYIKLYASDAWNWIVNVWGGIGKFFSDRWTTVTQLAAIAWYYIKQGAADVGAAFVGLSQQLSIAWGAITNGWKSASAWFKDHVTDPIAQFFKNMVNGVIDGLNGMIGAFVSSINAMVDAVNSLKFAIPSWIPGFGGQTFGIALSHVTAPTIPHLAEGAVIPPNNPRLAVVGDQTSGNNIEAPESKLREIFADVLRNSPQPLSLEFTGSLAQLARILEPQLQKERVRIGNSMVKRTGNVAIS